MADLYSWGLASIGMLGRGQKVDNDLVPTLIPGDWVSISSSFEYALAIKSDGTLWAWGNNTNNQLGTGGSTTTQTLVPTQVGTATDWAKVNAGYTHSLGLKANGQLWGWGDNQSGQLTGETPNIPAPVLIDGRVWTDIQALQAQSFALLTGGALFGCGRNTNGQLGIGNSTAFIRALTREVTAGIFSSLPSMSMNYNATAALKAEGSYWYGGTPDVDGLPTAVFSNQFRLGAAGPWAKMAQSSDGFVLAIKTDGTLWGWSATNNNIGTGVLGDGTTIGHILPAQIGTATNWSSVSAGFNNSAAINALGDLYVWGNNEGGQVGDNTLVNKLVPTLVMTKAGTVSSANAVTFSLGLPVPPAFWTNYVASREIR